MDELYEMIAALRDEVDSLRKRVRALEDKNSFVTYRGAASRKEERMVEKFGEYVDKSTAALILGITRATVYTMLSDGRIEGACEGRRVSVRSIARYQERKKLREKE